MGLSGWDGAAMALPRRLYYGTAARLVGLWNKARGVGQRPVLAGDLPRDVMSILEQSQTQTDISDHLLTLYAEAVEIKPKVMVELGVRSGESTRVLLMAAKRCSARLISVDIDDCSGVAESDAWTFVRTDDVQFGQNWPEWSRTHGLPETIDFLFIDTSHLHEHTVAEINVWFPHLGSNSKVVFHDTNLRSWYSRSRGWDNSRGVIRAIEEYLGFKVNERIAFTVAIDGWLVRHDPVCNGLTVLRKLQ